MDLNVPVFITSGIIAKKSFSLKKWFFCVGLKFIKNVYGAFYEIPVTLNIGRTKFCKLLCMLPPYLCDN